MATPLLTEDEIQAYIADLQSVLRVGDVEDRQEVLRRFIRSIMLYPNHFEIEYNFELSTLAP